MTSGSTGLALPSPQRRLGSRRHFGHGPRRQHGCRPFPARGCESGLVSPNRRPCRDGIDRGEGSSASSQRRLGPRWAQAVLLGPQLRWGEGWLPAQFSTTSEPTPWLRSSAVPAGRERSAAGWPAAVPAKLVEASHVLAIAPSGSPSTRLPRGEAAVRTAVETHGCTAPAAVFCAPAAPRRPGPGLLRLVAAASAKVRPRYGIVEAGLSAGAAAAGRVEAGILAERASVVQAAASRSPAGRGGHCRPLPSSLRASSERTPFANEKGPALRRGLSSSASLAVRPGDRAQWTPWTSACGPLTLAEVPPGRTMATFCIMPMSSWSRMWQWRTNSPM